MKLKEKTAITKDVKVYGVWLTLPINAEFVAIDSNGYCVAYEYQPHERHNYGWWADRGAIMLVAKFDMGKSDWRKTLRYVGD